MFDCNYMNIFLVRIKYYFEITKYNFVVLFQRKYIKILYSMFIIILSIIF